ncbi:acetyltransferase [Paenibacillus oryzae]|uniref:Acetyltransferase n=1 Tax=Paenibacillus oryzae TaxID=1844972 RepID=A0A1A5YI41_9BACL|nr:acetyltransferase [Paenibacillus oryzae]
MINLKSYPNQSQVKELLACCMWPDEEKIAQELSAYLEDDSRSLLGEVIDHTLVGLMGITRISNEKVILKHIAVKEEYRNKGIGKKMLQAYIANQRISLLEAETDLEAVDFYRRIGFQISSLGEKYKGVERFKCQYTK